MTNLVGQQFGSYQLVRYLGGGGFADVYLGQHTRISTQQAAIKILHLTDVNEQRFQREAEHTAALRHPHIVRLYDFAIQQGMPFLVLEYAPNGSLARHKNRQLPPGIIIQYLRQIVPALQYAHDNNVIHRDIKPDNILVGAQGELLISDFGIAVLSEAEHTLLQSASYTIGGTPLYMAPETFRGKSEKASDQYALGIMVYTWLCGSPPFTGENFLQIGYKHAYEPVPSLCERAPEIPPAVEYVVLKALAKVPEERYQSITAFADTLERAIQEPSTVVPELPPSARAPLPSHIPPNSGSWPPSQTPIPPMMPPYSSPQPPGSSPVTAKSRRKIFLIGAILAILLIAAIPLTLFLLHGNLSATTSQPTTVVVQVQANRPWTDTGINLTVNESVTISASGTIVTSFVDTTPRTPSGVPWNTCYPGTHLPFTAPGLPCASLIARIGQNGQIFEIGTGIQLVVTTPGRLYLGVNDNQYADNSGSWSATVVVHPAGTSNSASPSSASTPAPLPTVSTPTPPAALTPTSIPTSGTGKNGGSLLWHYQTGGSVQSSPEVAGGVVYIGSDDGYVYAINAGSGTVLWRYNINNNQNVSSATVANGVVYVNSYNGAVYALKASTGSLLWHYQTGNWIVDRPTVVNNVVYFGSGDNYLYALNASNGNLLWRYQTGYAVVTSPAVVNGVVYFGSWDSYVYALTASNGALLWRYQTGGYVESPPAVVNGVVYAGSSDNNIYALTASNGKLLWHYQTGGPVHSSPVIVGGVVYFGSYDTYAYALNASSGNLLWRYQTGGVIALGAAVASGVVYIGSNDGYLYALNASNGNLLWRYQTGANVHSTPAVANGVVYFGSGDDYVYALTTT
jgi:eukaryotic-like serine/threonine-protein kinase